MNEELKKLIEKLAKLEELSQEELDVLTKVNAQLEANKAQGVPQRRIDFSDDRGGKVRSITEILRLPERLLTDEEKEIQHFSDDMYILGTLLKTNPRTLKSWNRFTEHSSALRKALDSTTAGEGDEWVPTILSAQLIEAFRLESKVAGLFPDLPMPSNPYDIPFISGAPEFYFVPESTSDNPTAPPSSQSTTGKQTLTAKKLKARIYFSDELSEDSIVPILPTLKNEIGVAGAECVDDVLINGDTTATHMDSDVTDSKDRRKAWNGLRDLCPSGTKKDLSTFNYANHRTIIVALGKYGLKGDDLAILTGPKGINKYRSLSEVQTVDKYGPKAFIHTGELGKLDNIPLIASEKIRENLNASGVYDGTTTTYTQSIYVNKRGFMLGTRGVPKLTFLSDAEVDQNQLILRFRKAFTNRWTVSATVTTIGMAYKVS